jgi:hypothetical protein
VGQNRPAESTSSEYKQFYRSNMRTAHNNIQSFICSFDGVLKDFETYLAVTSTETLLLTIILQIVLAYGTDSTISLTANVTYDLAILTG